MTISLFIRRDYKIVSAYSGTSAIKDNLVQYAALVVQDEDSNPLGILTPQDVVQHAHILVVDCLTRRPFLSPECDIDEALRMMQLQHTEVLGVAQQGVLEGLIYKNDLLDYITGQNKDLEGAVSKQRGELQTIHHKLMLSQHILQAIIDSTPSAVVLVDSEYKILFFNRKAAEESESLYGKQMQMGISILDFIPQTRTPGWGPFETFKADFDRALAGESVIHERRIQFPDIFRWKRTEYCPVYCEEKMIGATITITDIDERKKNLLQIERQNELLKHISWVQSHYTRQPVATILGLTSIIEKASLSEENNKIIGMLEETTRKLDEVIRKTVLPAKSLEEGSY